MKRFLIVAAAGLAFSAPAWADCPNGYVPGYENVGGVAAPACITPVTTGEDGSVSGIVVDGDVVKNDADGNPQHISEQGPSPTFVFGPNGLAAGNGARVGSGHLEEASCSKGKPKKFILGWGCADEKGDWIKDAKHTPAHWVADNPVSNGTAVGAGAVVEHNNSTAIGAGAKSTDTNQVTLGTKGETVRAEGITSQKSKDRQQGPLQVVTSDEGGRLATDGGQIFSTLGTHNQQISALESLAASQGAQINANTALLSQHSAKLEDHSKGLAIAMAMPDAWLSDKKRFGIFGAIGGFDGETAMGFAAIGRIDETFSLNAKLGADMDFDQFGWQVGVGAQW